MDKKKSNIKLSFFFLLFILLTSACAPQLDKQRHAMKSTMDSYLGTRYRYGGASTSGIDCSAFTQKVYASAGISIPRTTEEQFKTGQAVEEDDDYRFGDLVFFDTGVKSRRGPCCLLSWLFFFRSSKPSTPTHVGIYNDGGEFYHASSSRGVTKDNLSESYWENTFLGARRILKETPD